MHSSCFSNLKSTFYSLFFEFFKNNKKKKHQKPLQDQCGETFQCIDSDVHSVTCSGGTQLGQEVASSALLWPNTSVHFFKGSAG